MSQGEAGLSCRPPSEPAPESNDNLPKLKRLRPREVKPEPRWRIRWQELDHHVDHVVELHDLELAGIRHTRQHGPCRKIAKHRAGAIANGTGMTTGEKQHDPRTGRRQLE